jgi:hypothetical protein
MRHAMPPGGTMDSAQSAVAKVIAAKRPKRRLRTAEEKKRIVEETMAKEPRWRGWLGLMVFISVRFMIGARNIVRRNSAQKGDVVRIYCR